MPDRLGVLGAGNFADDIPPVQLLDLRAENEPLKPDTATRIVNRLLTACTLRFRERQCAGIGPIHDSYPFNNIMIYSRFYQNLQVLPGGPQAFTIPGRSAR